MVIATHANRYGRAWPSSDTIAHETGRHIRTVIKAVDRIEEAGVIDVIHRRGRSCEFVFPQDPHPWRSAPNPWHPALNPWRSATHKNLEELQKNAPDAGRFTTWRPAGETQDAGPVDMRALLAGMKAQLAARSSNPEGMAGDDRHP
jgi:DNA-binding transcriptional MocR family regulator